MTNNSTDLAFYIFAAIFGILFFAIIVGALGKFLLDFFRELSYLNKEIDCTSGPERRYWLQQRKELWLSLIPFIKH